MCLPGRAAEERLDGRRVLITGASGHLGSALATALRTRGATVLGLARRGNPDIIECDVTDSGSTESAVAQAVQRLGGLDLLIHCAGVGGPGAIGEAPSEADLQIMEVNLWGAWRVTSAALPALVEARGGIIFTSSLMAYAATPFARTYAISKRALGAYADVLRSEYGSHVAVTTLYPGHFDTPLQEQGREVGLSMDDKVPHENLADIVRVVLGVATDPRPPMDVTTAMVGEAGLQICRRAPGVGATLVNRRTRELVLAGALDDAGAAAGMRALLADTDGLRQDVMGPAGMARAIRGAAGLTGELVSRFRDGAAAVAPVWALLGPVLAAVAATVESVGDEDPRKALGLSDSDLDALRDAGSALAGQILPSLLIPGTGGAPALLDPRVLALVLLGLQSFVDRTSHQVAADAAGSFDAPRR